MGLTSRIGTSNSTLGRFQVLGYVPAPVSITLLSALAIRENVFQLTFSLPVYFSQILDPPDGSIPSKYTVAPVPGTIGVDGNPTRPVTVVSAALAQPANVGGDLPPGATFGTVVDITTDRVMSPFPAAYTVTVDNIYDSTLASFIDPQQASTPSLYRVYVPPSTDLPSPNRDFANPQSLFGTLTLDNPQNVQNLGVFPITDGDYAIDSGLQGYKKRCFRRLYTAVGGFLHLGNSYGVGIPQQAKKLARPAVIASLAASAESQIAQEPETKACSVTGIRDPNAPGLVRFSVVATTKSGASTKFSAAFPMST